MNTTQTVSTNTGNTEFYTRSIAQGGLALKSQHMTKLKLLSEINGLSDPSLSAEQLLGYALLHIREYYKANACLAVMKMPDDSYIIFKADKDTAKPMLLGHALDESIAVHLLAIPPQTSIFYTPQAEWSIASQIVDKKLRFVAGLQANARQCFHLTHAPAALVLLCPYRP